MHGLGKPFVYIHPHKQEAVKFLTKNAPSWVTHIIVFGSAVHSWHYPDSDLDICIVGENPGAADDDFSYRKQMKLPGCTYDFVEFADMEALLCDASDLNGVGRSILEEGVLVYGQSRLAA